jgi:hypothetical protein
MAPNHHEKNTNLPSKINTFSRTPLKKAPKNQQKGLSALRQKNLLKITKPNPPPIEKSCSRNES